MKERTNTRFSEVITIIIKTLYTLFWITVSSANIYGAHNKLKLKAIFKLLKAQAFVRTDAWEGTPAARLHRSKLLIPQPLCALPSCSSLHLLQIKHIQINNTKTPFTCIKSLFAKPQLKLSNHFIYFYFYFYQRGYELYLLLVDQSRPRANAVQIECYIKHPLTLISVPKSVWNDLQKKTLFKSLTTPRVP